MTTLEKNDLRDLHRVANQAIVQYGQCSDDCICYESRFVTNNFGEGFVELLISDAPNPKEDFGQFIQEVTRKNGFDHIQIRYDI